MAPMIFTRSILKGEPIKIFNYGKMKRDFTYIDDIVEGIIKCCFKPATINLNSISLILTLPLHLHLIVFLILGIVNL